MKFQKIIGSTYKKIKRLSQLCAFTFVLMTYSISNSFSQINVEWNNPSPQGHTINDMYSFNNKIFAASEYGHLITFDTLGTLINDVYTGTEDEYLKIIKVNDNSAYLLGKLNKIYNYSFTDRKLEIIKPDTFSKINSAAFIDNTLLLICHDHYVVKSTDNGKTWTKYIIPYSPDIYNFVFNDLYFHDSLTGFVVGSNGINLKTTNGGKTWETNYFNCDQNFIKINFLNDSFGYILSNKSFSGQLFATKDGGKNWTHREIIYPNLSENEVYNVLFKDTIIGFASGNDKIFKTNDGGKNWLAFNLNISPYLKFKGITFLNDRCLITGQYGLMLSSGFDSFDINYLGSGFSNNLNAIDINNSFISIAANNKNILKSIDNGMTWTRSSIVHEKEFDLFGISFVDSLNGYSSGYESYAQTYKCINITNDGGKTWTTKYTPSILKQIYFKNANQGFGISSSMILYTKDKGLNWGDASSINNITDFHIYSDIGFAVGKNGCILKLNSAGTYWYNITSPTTLNLNGVYCINKDKIVIVGDSGSVYITSNQGVLWNKISVDCSNKLNSVVFKDSINGIACGNNGIILVSNDGGLSWYVKNTFIKRNLVKVKFIDFNNALVIGNNGCILKVNAEQYFQSIKQFNNDSRILLFPNPAKDFVKINIKPNQSIINSITILSLEGKVVKQIIPQVNELELTIELTNLPKGIYFVKVMDEKGVWVSKVMKE